MDKAPRGIFGDSLFACDLTIYIKQKRLTL